jgi:hypothetical protein
MLISRRRVLQAGGLAVAVASQPSWARPASPIGDVIGRAEAALRLHRNRFAFVDRIGIVDFSKPSSAPRLFILDRASGRVAAHLVAHGRGSDPAHTGWASRFSNEPGSFASSNGTYATADHYSGAHGASMRLQGLDAGNSNAEARAIVVHGAWYVSPEIARSTGKLGRSEGCFAVSAASLETVLTQLGPGRMLFAEKA